MPKYLIKVAKTTKEYWHVEADNLEDAVLFYQGGEISTEPRVIGEEINFCGEAKESIKNSIYGGC